MQKARLIALITVAILTIVSLALNVSIILALAQARQIAVDTVDEARSVVNGIRDDTFSYTVTVNQEVPVAVSVPFSDEVTVPVQMVVPIDTTVVVPIDLGITTYNLSVPIRTAFPLDTEFTVPFSQTFDVATTVQVDIDVPVEIPLAEIPLIRYLDDLDRMLAALEAMLVDPLGLQEE